MSQLWAAARALDPAPVWPAVHQGAPCGAPRYVDLEWDITLPSINEFTTWISCCQDWRNGWLTADIDDQNDPKWPAPDKKKGPSTTGPAGFAQPPHSGASTEPPKAIWWSTWPLFRCHRIKIQESDPNVESMFNYCLYSICLYKEHADKPLLGWV